MKWLGESDSNENIKYDEDQNFIIENYKQLFEVAPSLKLFPNKNYFGNLLHRLRGQLGFDTMRQFSIFLGVNNTQMFYWINNTSTPSPEKLLHIAKQLNCTVYDLISYENLYLKVKVDGNDKTREVGKITKAEMEKHLRNAAYTDTTPKSFAAVCREGGFSNTAAKNNFPNLSQLILDNYALYRKESLIQRQKDIEIILKEILTQKTPNSLKKSLEDYGISVRMAQKYHPELCRKIIERNQHFIKVSKEKRTNAYEDEVKSIIFDLQQKGIYPSLYQINKVISNPNIFMERHFRTLRKQILRTLGYEM